MLFDREHSITLEWLQTLTEPELLALYETVNTALKLVEDNAGTIYESAGLPSAVDSIADTQFRTVDNLTKKLAAGKISKATFNVEIHDAIHQAFTDAYAAGMGVGVDDLTPGDREWVARASNAEAKFAAGFGNDVVAKRVGKFGKMSRRGRAAAYGMSVKAAAWNAMVEKQPPGTKIIWKLGNLEHCDDCILLASNSPYTKLNLPTVPKAGDTQCIFNCGCKLQFRKGVPSRAEKRSAAAMGRKREATLSDMLRPPIPTGLRAPTGVESKYIETLRNQINHYRHLIGSGTLSDLELESVRSARKLLNVELIEFLEKNSIYDVPVFSVDQVVTGEHIGLRAKSEIARHGLDGGSIGSVDAERLAASLKRFEKAAGTTFGDDAIVADLVAAGYEEPALLTIPTATVTKQEATGDKKRLGFSALQYKARVRDPGRETWVLSGVTLKDTFDVLAQVVWLSVGRDVVVSPFDDELLARVGVWIDGERKDVIAIISEMGGERWLR
jgi:hypothetical protein